MIAVFRILLQTFRHYDIELRRNLITHGAWFGRSFPDMLVEHGKSRFGYERQLSREDLEQNDAG